MNRLAIAASSVALAACLTLSAAAAPLQANASPARVSAATLPLPLQRRVEVAFRLRANLPAAADVHVGARTPSEFAGFDRLTITYSVQGRTSSPIPFLLSADGNKLVQLREFDVAKDPRTMISEEDRPARGGPSTAPVLIVGFDDLECPFCAHVNATLFPAILDRYKDQVRIVYREVPSDGHPWAKRAAIDTACLGSQSPAAYWQAVDQLHREAGTIGGPEHSIQNASHTVDRLVREIAGRNQLDARLLNACVERQDPTAVDRSIQQATALGIGATPTLFINGAKIEGDVPLAFVFQMIDSALIAEGKTPPPATSSSTAPSNASTPASGPRF